MDSLSKFEFAMAVSKAMEEGPQRQAQSAATILHNQSH